MENICPLCKIRISDHADATGKVDRVKGVPVHLLCKEDFKLRYGKEYTGEEIPKA